MLKLRIFRLLHDKRLSVPLLRYFHHEFTQPEPQKTKQDAKKPKIVTGESLGAAHMVSVSDMGCVANKKAQEERHIPAAVRLKYKVFRDEDSTEIFDVEEERQRYQIQDLPEHTKHDEYIGLNLKRGLHGVFDVEDLVDVLRKENAEDVFVCSVPKELKYVDYMVVCNGRSYRHMLAMAEFVRRIYKIKRTKSDALPRIEGEKSRQWMALDLGNIALHIFSPEAREVYDLESLWAIGPEYDKEYNKPQDPLVELFEQHTQLLSNVKPKIKNTDS